MSNNELCLCCGAVLTPTERRHCTRCEDDPTPFCGTTLGKCRRAIRESSEEHTEKEQLNKEAK